MTFGESLSVAWASLLANKLRSLLTMLGIIIGVAAVVALMAIGQGAQDSITGALTSTGTNLLAVIPGAINQGGVRSAGGSAPTLTLEDAQAIATSGDCPYCILVAPEVQRQASVVYGGQNNTYTISGTTPEYGEIRNLPLAAGDWFGTGDINAATNVAVIGANVASGLFEGADPLGQSIRINRLAFRVVGVRNSRAARASARWTTASISR